MSVRCHAVRKIGRKDHDAAGLGRYGDIFSVFFRGPEPVGVVAAVAGGTACGAAQEEKLIFVFTVSTAMDLRMFV